MDNQNKIAPNRAENLPVYKDNSETEKELLNARKDAIVAVSKDFGVIAKQVATGLIELKKEQQMFSNELKKTKQICDNNIKTIKANYSVKKNMIDENLEMLRSLRKTLELFDVLNLTESQERTYNALLQQITILVDNTTQLYNGIL